MTTLIPDKSLEAKPWGFWMTIVFSLIAFMVMSIIQGVVLVVYAINNGIKFDINDTQLSEKISKLALDGDLLGLAEIPAATIGVGLIILFSAMRKPLTVKKYLQLYWPKLITILKWLGIMFLGMVAMQITMVSLGTETPQFMTEVYGSTENKALLWVAVIIGAPFFEEFLFRGFLLEGLRHSFAKITSLNIGTTLAVLITSGVWAVIHMQYGWIEIANIFAIGVILGIARVKSGSLYIPILMHMMMNFFASLAMEFQPELEQFEKATLGIIQII